MKRIQLLAVAFVLCAAVVMFPFRLRAADIVWTNASGNWNAAANWSPNQVPGAADNAFITNNGTYTVTLNAAATVASLTVGGASGIQTFTNSAQTLTLNGASTVNANGVFGLGSSGTLTGAGDLTINSPFNWTGGTISGASRLFANGGLTLSGSTKVLTGRMLVNAGAATWSAGQINFASGAVLSNAASGTFDCTFDGNMANSGGTGQAVANAGLFRKIAGAAATTINSPITFNNSGTVEVQSGTLALNSGGTNTGNFTMLSGATLNLGGGNHALTAGTITGAGTLAVSGGTASFVGTLGITSILTVSGGTADFNGSSGAITPVQLNVSGGTLGGSDNITVSGAMNWTGGTISGTNTVFANGGLILSGSTKVLTGRTLVNAGAATWSAGQINMVSGAVLSNASTGTFDCAFDGNMANGGGSGQAVANAGLFRKTASTNATTIFSPIAFNNTGTVEIQSGTLTLSGGGTDTGNFTTANGATLNLGGGTHNLTNVTITGAGTFSVSGGIANFAGTLGGDGTLDVSGGTANFNVSSAITLARLVISGGTLGGSSTFTVSGTMTWTGGTISGSGSVIVSGGLTLSGFTKVLTGRTLVNAGAATWSAGQINFVTGGVLSNASIGTFDCAFDGNMANGGGTGQAVANSGLFRKTVGAGATTIFSPIAFNNTGTVEVQSGTLVLNGGGTDIGGSFTTANGTTLNLSGGTHNLTNVTITGVGTFSVSGGTANFGGTLGGNGTLDVSGGTANFGVSSAITLAQLIISGGTLGGSSSFEVSGAMSWTGGTISGFGSVTASGGLTLSGSTKILTGRTLVNAGTAIWSAGQINFSSGGVLSNASTGTFDCAFDGNMANSGGTGQAVANAGLFRKTAGTNATTIFSPIAFNNTGTVEVQTGVLSLSSTYLQTAGLTLLNGGSFTISGSPVQIRGGVLAGNGLITGNVSNNAVLSPGASAGLLLISGNYTQTVNGALHIELAGTSPAVTFDQLIVSNAMNLGGALNVTLTNGFYPAPDFTFSNVVRAASRTGTFATFSFPSNAIGLQVNYGTTNVDIEVINTLPTLPAITDKTVDELTLLNFNVGATDADAPAQTLSYRLTNSPSGAAINSSGQITWTPTEAEGPNTNEFTVVVTDDGAPNLTVTQLFQVVVNEINVAPALTLPANQNVNELVPLNLLATAHDTDIPTNTLVFELVSGPAGLTVSPEGAIAWTPTEAQGSNTYAVTIRVVDTNAPAVNETSLSTTNSFTITVNEVNLAPVLTVPADQVLTEETPLSVSASATDADLPANALTFSLASPPAGMTINAANGAIAWTPTEAQGSNSYAIRVVVTDANPLAVNATSISVTNTFVVTVNESNRPPVLTVPANQIITEETPLSVAATATDPDLPANTLTFALVSGPSGLNVEADGAITWTPTEAQGSNSYTVSVRVTDNNPTAINAQQLSVTNSFTIQVNESNRPPALTVPANQIITEETPLSITATATDPDLPANALTFALVSGPAGLNVAPDGAITWTPTESQGSNTYVVTLSVTDNNPTAVNAPQLSVTNSFMITVNESNRPPVLTVPGTQTIDELTQLSVSASATDPDVPANALSFALVSPPAGMTINATSGAISWTPIEAQGSNSYTVSVSVTDNNPTAINAEQLSVTNSFTVIVNESNQPPVLTVPTNQTINELTLYTNNATATDGDLPANALRFALVSGPFDMIVSSNGAISWAITEAHGPGTYTVLISVTDTNPTAVNATSLSVTQSFQITVNEVNSAPVLTVPENAAINELQLYTAQATATDNDFPANALTFALVSGPVGLTVSSTGAISWTPTEAQGPETNTVRIRVSDNGSPSLSVTQSFQLIVNEVNLAPVLTVPPNATIHAGVTYSNNATATDADVPTNTLTFALVSGPAGLTASPGGQIVWPITNAAPGAYPVSVRVFDNGAPSLSATQTFTLTIVAAPFVTIQNNGNTNTLTWTAINGTSYRVQFKNDLNVSGWTDLAGDVAATAALASKTDGPLSANTNRFYRIRVLP